MHRRAVIEVGFRQRRWGIRVGCANPLCALGSPLRVRQTGDAEVHVVVRHRIAAAPSGCAERYLLPMSQGSAVGVKRAAQPSSPGNTLWLKG
ncbi:hypothetical protein XAP412_320058 [Xanthomonas phaseoli pv. phaseoli]|uniref:Uncharacterized protein n=1 Tax=Xanthomonas campestris pv. phaseoli TaxID=317013 RepID=A0AB38E1E8_XANCH|nr:hypothetical protein XAP6984_380055 [Xanthomonas phaseoli pv. phaseoli]SON83817.1 hypothetical protein XAP412_320058 [Xanthomonas phaseoli pv. phaseoli]SON88256.1 hypothetical protein XAP7430_360058 [Xanthomonas phaseoli pv. phaseoli]